MEQATLYHAAQMPPDASLKVQAAYFAEAAARAPNARELREAVAASFLQENGVKTYGQRIRDPLSGKSVDVSPYAKAAPGTTAIVTTVDPATGEMYVLLGQKQKNPRNKKEGLSDFIAPGGYMESLPPEGATKKEIAASDFNLEAASRRELFEETGLKIPKEIVPVSLGVNSDADQNPHTQSVNEFFHYSLSGKPEDIPVKASDDLKTAQWVNVRGIIKNHDGERQPAGSDESRYKVVMEDGAAINLRDLHGIYVEQAVERVREQLLNVARPRSVVSDVVMPQRVVQQEMQVVQ